MSEGELAHLRGGGFDQFLVAVAERRAPQPGHALDIGLAVGVVDIDALAALDDERTGLAKSREIDVRMHQRFDVAGGEIAERRHSGPSLLYALSAAVISIALFCARIRRDRPRPRQRHFVRAGMERRDRDPAAARLRLRSLRRRVVRRSRLALRLRLGRRRYAHVPFANLVIVAALFEIEMDVLLVIAVGAGAEHGRKSRAGAGTDGFAPILVDMSTSVRPSSRPSASLKSRTSSASARPCSLTLRGVHVVAAAAVVGSEIVEPAQRRQVFQRRRDVLAHPIGDRLRHRAAQYRRRRHRDFAPIGQDDRVHLHGIVGAAIARPDQDGQRLEFRDLRQAHLAGRRLRRRRVRAACRFPETRHRPPAAARIPAAARRAAAAALARSWRRHGPAWPALAAARRRSAPSPPASRITARQ